MLFFSAFVIFFIAVAVGQYHAKLGDFDKPIWPVKLVISYFLLYRGTKKMAQKELSRRDFPFLEQFMAATLVWFIILFFTYLIVTGLFVPELYKRG